MGIPKIVVNCFDFISMSKKTENKKYMFPIKTLLLAGLLIFGGQTTEIKAQAFWSEDFGSNAGACDQGNHARSEERRLGKE